MRHSIFFRVLLLAQLAFLPAVSTAWGGSVPPEIAIQGKLEHGDQTPLVGTRVYRVRFFDAQTNGNQIGANLTGSLTLSSTGRFSVALIPPAAAVQTDFLFYELAIDSAVTPDGAINPADVFPNRVQVHSVPFALHAAKADELATTFSAPIQMSIDGVQAGQIARSVQNFFNIAFGAVSFIDSSSQGGTISGGFHNRVLEDSATIAGGSFNSIDDLQTSTTVNAFGFIGGGTDNTVRAYGGAIGGGQGNVASGQTTAISGGFGNTGAGNNSSLGGGTANIANGDSSTIAGGRSNQTFDNNGTIGGGFSNKTGTNNASATDTIDSVVGGGSFNIASGLNSTVSGGDSNAAQSDFATVPGGQGNVAFGQYSFAAGRRAHANHNGVFIWSDDFNNDFTSTADNQFLIRANGGVGINKANPANGTLDVSGDIAFNGAIHGNVARTATTAGLRIVRGVIFGSGTPGAVSILEGDGITAVRAAAVGSYDITYTAPFKASSFPTVTATAFGATVFAIIGSSTSGAVNIQFKDAAGNPADPSFFHLIAIGL